MAMSTTPKIAIIGAGPGGLTLARILHCNNIPVTVFERDESRHARSQGGSLDLHEGSAQAALKVAGIYDEFVKHARYEGQDLIVSDRFGKRWVEILNQDRGRPEIDRSKLREILIDSLPSTTIRWKSNLRRVERGTLHFEHGTETGFDLIVGADGAWSKVRSILTDVMPFHSGISGFELVVHDVDEKHTQLVKRIGQGNYFVFGEETGQAFLCQRNGGGILRVYALGKHPENWLQTSGIDLNNSSELRASILKDFSDWPSEVLEIIQASDNEILPRTISMLPPGLRWTSTPGVTVIGDAAHLMSPFTGEGVNVAMFDALKLSQAILRRGKNVADAVIEYEAWMFPNAFSHTSRAWKSLLSRFNAGGCAEAQARFNGQVKNIIMKYVRGFLSSQR